MYYEIKADTDVLLANRLQVFFTSGFLNRREGAENIKYKFRFALKLPIICINQ